MKAIAMGPQRSALPGSSVTGHPRAAMLPLLMDAVWGSAGSSWSDNNGRNPVIHTGGIVDDALVLGSIGFRRSAPGLPRRPSCAHASTINAAHPTRW
jgi:hypothetical protein